LRAALSETAERDLASELTYEAPRQLPPVAVEAFPDGGVTLTVRPPAVGGLLPKLLKRRRALPLVVGVGPHLLYVQDPRRWVKVRQSCRHDLLDDLSVRRHDVLNRGWRTGEHYYRLELHVRFEWPLVILEASTPHELLRIGNQLRVALKFPPQVEPLAPAEAARQARGRTGRQTAAG
jgi:hypothetical protein